MSFFLNTAPNDAQQRFVKPREEQASESGIIRTRRALVAFWRGSYNFAPQTDEDYSLLGELERADKQGSSFYADIYKRLTPRAIDAVWESTATHQTYGFSTTAADAVNYGEGSVVSIRNSIDRSRVTARIITRRTTTGSTHTFEFETPVPLEFMTTRAGIVVEVCFNRPHVSAKIKSPSTQWNASFRQGLPAAVEWVEDTGGNLLTLKEASNTPTLPGQPVGDTPFLVNDEDSAYIVTDDGRFIEIDP